MTTLVLLPGLLCDDAVWAHQRGVLPADEFIVPSFGPLDSIGAMAEHVLASVAAPRFSLAGHSMGGRVALEVVRRAPRRIERLALLDTGVDPIAPGADGEREREGRLALLETARREGMRAMGRQWAHGMVHASRLGSALFEQILDMIERKTPDIFAAQIAALLARPDARGVLRSVRCDTLLLCGRDDAWSPLSRHEQMHTMLPSARLSVIEDCGHMSTMEQPEAVSAALAAWLHQPPAAPRWGALRHSQTAMDELQSLLIERACSRLVLLAAEHADHHRPAELAALFAPDGVLVRPNAEPLYGRESIRRAYGQRPAQRITRHMVTNIRVEVLSDVEARATSVVLLWAGAVEDEPGPRGRPAQPGQVLGEFDDRFSLTAEGWRIASRTASFLLHS